MSKMHIKAKDTVMVISGFDNGKIGVVKAVFPDKNKITLDGKDPKKPLKMITKHVKPRQQGQPGGRVQMDRAIDASNVMLICTKCNKPTRVAIKIMEDGSKVRVCKHKDCHEVIDN
jgi:large subunit ribosomal protein L24